jgi:hypothetical protein
MEFVASPEWAELVRNDFVFENIRADNDYIDFDELEIIQQKKDEAIES